MMGAGFGLTLGDPGIVVPGAGMVGAGCGLAAGRLVTAGSVTVGSVSTDFRHADRSRCTVNLPRIAGQ
jgi:hypothetical protein